MVKLFDKYDFLEVKCNDPSLENYVCLNPVRSPHSFGRHAKKQFGKKDVNIVERLINKLMRGGTGEKAGGKVIRTHGAMQGKKFKAVKIVKKAFDEIAQKTKQNPIQVLVDALQNTAPREDTTRVQYGGVSYQVAVDVSAERRLDMALRNIAMASIIGTFNKKKPFSSALADEIILASKGDISSYAIKKRDQTERMARGAR
ncbi:MAG: 30S ribosomal protein S7 [Candidatus Micrarchaeota archaeon]